MNQRIVLRSVFALGLSLLLAAAAQAQAFRTYLSGAGNDGNPCTLAAPCRLLPAAIAAVVNGGEIWMLDSANYNTGPVNVNKSVTILAVPGALGSVVALGGNAIDIATAGVKVTLRNLVIVPLVGGGGTSGINMTAGASLTVDKCLIANLPATAIYVGTDGATVLVVDSVIKSNGLHGLHVASGADATVTRTTFSENVIGTAIVLEGSDGTTTTADVTDSTIAGNYNGLFAQSGSATGAAKASVRNSQIVRNSQYGAIAYGSTATLSMSNNIVSNNATGIAAGTSGKAWLSGNTVSDNSTGLSNSASLLETAGDNAVRNNGTNSSGTITVLPKL